MNRLENLVAVMEARVAQKRSSYRNANEMPHIFTSSPPSLCPLSACHSSFPSRFVIGRSRGEAVAERRREELNGYIWHLIHAAPEVAEVSEWLGVGGCERRGPESWGSHQESGE